MTILSVSKIVHGIALDGNIKNTVKPLKSQAGTSEGTSNFDIIDIRHDAVEINLKEETLSSLKPLSGPKKMPTLLLYDERGLQLFEEVSSHSWGKRTPCINGRIDHVFGRILSHQRGNRCS